MQEKCFSYQYASWALITKLTELRFSEIANAVSRASSELVSEALSEIKNIKVKEFSFNLPLFNRIFAFIRKVNETDILILEPNIFGVGGNINNLIKAWLADIRDQDRGAVKQSK